MKTKKKNKDKVNPNVAPATTKNKREAALKAIGLWNDDPNHRATKAEALETVKKIRNGTWRNQK